MLARQFAAMAFLTGCLLAGCGSDTGGSAPNGGSAANFLDTYLSQNASSPAATPLIISGVWRGLLYCGGRDFPVLLSIGEGKTNIATIDPMIGKPTNQTPFYKPYRDTDMSADYLSDIQQITLLSTQPQDERRLLLRMLIDPRSANQALLYAAEMQGPHLRRSCEFGIVGKDSGAAPIDHFSAVMRGLYKQRRPVNQDGCPAAYKAWLDDALALEQTNPLTPDLSPAVRDEAFISAFGKTYAEMSADDLLSAGQILQGSCIPSEKGPERQNTRRKAVMAISYLTNHRYYQANRHHALRAKIAGHWIDWIDAEINRKAPIAPASLAAAGGIPRTFAMASLDARADTDLAQRILAYSNSMRVRQRQLDFVRAMDAGKSNFKSLLAKHAIAGSRDDLDQTIAALALDSYLLPAAKILTSQNDTRQEAVYMASWIEAYQTGQSCPAKSPSTCDEVIRVFDAATKKAASTFADRLAPQSRDMYADIGTLEALKAAVTAQRQLQRDYGLLFDSEAFDDVRSTLSKARRKRQKSLRKKLLAQAKAQTTAPKLNEIKTAYFLSDDLAQNAVKGVAAVLEEKLLETTPFKDLPGAAYFNALYNQDFAQLRRLDAYYLERIRPLIDFGTQQLVLMGPLLDAIGGSPKGTAERDIQRSVRNLSALYPIMGTYLVDYQDVYEPCLERNAVTFRITQRTDQVTRDGLGRELKRVRGWTQRDDYRINREFEGNFRTLFDAATDSGGAQLFDLFLNDGRVSQLRSGMKRLMANTPCASQAIQRLERGMIAYDRDVARRMRGR